MSIYKKLLEIQKQVIGLGRDGKGNNYTYVSGSKVIEHIKPVMNKVGLILKQEVISIENTRMDYATKSNPNKSEILSKVMMRFTWIDTETGEKDVNEFGANGQNDFEKGLGSAITYGERYFLLKYFHIATDEDDIDNPERKKEEAELIEKTCRNINVCKDKNELTKLWKGLSAELRANAVVLQAVKDKGAEFEAAQPKLSTVAEQMA